MSKVQWLSFAVALVSSFVAFACGECVGVPVRLLEPAEGGTQVAANEDGFRLLRSVTGPVSIVAFVGRARSGKSFTLNHLIGCSGQGKGGFAVGHSVLPKTKGAELWGDPFAGTDGHNTTVLLLDTEGLGASPSMYDKAMLLFTAMVSSRVVYHLSEYIYLDDVTRLYSIVNLVKVYQKKNLKTVELPPLTWVVQRYTLESFTEDPKKVLLERFLKEQPNPSSNPIIAEFNETAKVVKAEFDSHEAFFIPPAVKDAASFTRLPNMERSELDGVFLAMMEDLRRVVLATPAKKLDRNSKPLTGPELADFALSILPAVNEGGAFLGDKVIEGVAKQLVSACFASYESKMADLELPMDEAPLHDAHFVARVSAITRFDDEMIGDARSYAKDVFRMELQRAIEKSFIGTISANALASAERCGIIVDSLMKSLRSHDYAGNLRLYDHEAALALQSASETLHGPKAADCLARLQREIRSYREVIGVGSLPGKVMSVVRSCAWLFVVAVAVIYFSRVVPNVLPSPLVQAAELVAFGSILFVALSVWSLGGGPVSPQSLVSLSDGITAVTSFVFEWWHFTLPAFVGLISLMVILRPGSASAVALSLRDTPEGDSLAGGAPSTFFVDNCSSDEYLRSVAESLFAIGGSNAPVLTVGWRRMLGVRAFPRVGLVHLCAVGRPQDVLQCQAWLSDASRVVSGGAPTRDSRATWSETHVSVLAKDCVAMPQVVPSDAGLKEDLTRLVTCNRVHQQPMQHYQENQQNQQRRRR